MKTENSKCLLLNADYSPISVIPWTRAMIWYVKYQNSDYEIDIIDFYKNDHINGTNNKKYPVPAVAKTKKFFKIHKHSINFSRKNIFIRDNYTCQYCNMRHDIRQLTYDHVIPKSKWDYNKHGSPTNWTNIVTCCGNCNRKKGDKTPEQANMKLTNYPVMPTKNFKYLPVAHLLSKIDRIPEEWKLYLPQSYSLID